jgi:hypothetical protein
VSQRRWYQGGYRAQVVAHTIAKLAWNLQKRNDSVNFANVWLAQALTPGLREAIEIGADAVVEVVTRPVLTGQNITEWAKQQACWNRVQSLVVDWPPRLSRDLQSMAEAKE